jgi:RHH-type transcriptional regulator, rel operon repressor / antitoxin RelB
MNTYDTSEHNDMPGTITVTVRLSKEAKAKLDALAASTKRTKNYLAAEAITAYVDENAWQIEAIQEAIVQADRGEASYAHEEVMSYLERRANGDKGAERPKPISTT